MKNESHAVCDSFANIELNAKAKVSIFMKESPQVNATASIAIYPMPRVDKMAPIGDFIHGGTKVLLLGQHFRVLGPPFCYFEDVAVAAFVLPDTTMTCFAPEHKAGSVQVRVSLDGGTTMQGSQIFSFFEPIILHEVSPSIAVNNTKIFLMGSGFWLNMPIKVLVLKQRRI